MTLNASGPISLAGATAGQSIAVELGLGATTAISLNDASVRSLAGVASGAITMPTNFFGKSNFTLGVQGGSGPVNYEVDVEGADITFKLLIGSNGSIGSFIGGGADPTINTPDSAIDSPISAGQPTAYGTPIGAGVGSNFEVSYSGAIFVYGSGALLRLLGTDYANVHPFNDTFVTTPFVPLSTDRTITCLATGLLEEQAYVTVGGDYGAQGIGTVTIRKIGDPSITTSFTIATIDLIKSGR